MQARRGLAFCGTAPCASCEFHDTAARRQGDVLPSELWLDALSGRCRSRVLRFASIWRRFWSQIALLGLCRGGQAPRSPDSVHFRCSKRRVGRFETRKIVRWTKSGLLGFPGYFRGRLPQRVRQRAMTATAVATIAMAIAAAAAFGVASPVATRGSSSEA